MWNQLPNRMGLPGRVALVAAAWSALLIGLTALAFATPDPYDPWVRWLDLEDLVLTAPVAALVALVCGTVEMTRRRRGRGLVIVATLLALVSLGSFAWFVAALMGAGAIVQNL
jgi:hypothetical protein